MVRETATTWENAKKISLEEAVKRFKVLYVETTDEYYPVENIRDLLQNHDGIDNLRIYGTQTTYISMNATKIIEDCCDDSLHADALDSIRVRDIKELQELLDEWCAKQEDATRTYFPDFKVGVLLPDLLEVAQPAPEVAQE